MNWQAVSDYEEMSRLGAQRLFAAVTDEAGRRVNLGLATGNTMLKVYEYLAGLLNAAGTDLSRLHTYNLDEYLGPDGRSLDERQPLSYRRYMTENLFRRLDPGLNFSRERMHFPEPDRPERYDAEIAAGGGLNLQLLGIGFNGHIAFNEPQPESMISAAAFAALPTRRVTLDETTIATNARLTAGGDRAGVPRAAVTQGMSAILAAREILLLACFPEQAAPLQRLRSGKITPELPASFLLGHPRATVAYTADRINL